MQKLYSARLCDPRYPESRPRRRYRVFPVHRKADMLYAPQLPLHLSTGRDNDNLMPPGCKAVGEPQHVPLDAAFMQFGKNLENLQEDRRLSTLMEAPVALLFFPMEAYHISLSLSKRPERRITNRKVSDIIRNIRCGSPEQNRKNGPHVDMEKKHAL